MSHDPMHYVDSVNLYAFAGFDPINSWDPMGLESGDLAGKKLKPVFKPLEEIEEPFDDAEEDDESESDAEVSSDPMDGWNPSLQAMKAAYLLFKADQRERDRYWTENQRNKFGDLVRPDAEFTCGVSCELGLLAALGDGVEATVGIGVARAKLLTGLGRGASKIRVCSFTQDTPVMMCDGELRAIQEVREGLGT